MVESPTTQGCNAKWPSVWQNGGTMNKSSSIYRYHHLSGPDFFFWAFVVNFIFSNFSRLRFRAECFQNVPPH
jgi:hypothetical protein